jgi:1-acyl-sn-glycerol-3-phosphate acyltransferase
MIRRILASVAFVIVTVLLSIVSIPAALIDRSGKLYSILARLWSRIFHALFAIKIVVLGAEHISKNEHYVFAANHSSYTDIPALFVAIPKDIRLVLRHTLTRIPIWGWSLLVSPFIIINRSNAAESKRTLLRAVETIRAGASVLLFPEGTRTPNGKLQEFKRGAFHLAYASGAKVIPVSISGTFELLPRTERLPKTHRTVTVMIGAPIEVSAQIEGDRDKEIDLMMRARAQM